jgi:hypothetical protein
VNIKTIIKPGDTVKVTTKDNDFHELKVVEITDDAITGESEVLLFTEIDNIQKDTTSFGRKTLRVIGGAVIVPVLVLEDLGGGDNLRNIAIYSSSQRPYRNVYPDALSIEMEIKPGDTIRVITKGNMAKLPYSAYEPKVYIFKVVEVTQDSIIGESQKIDIINIFKLEKML